MCKYLVKTRVRDRHCLSERGTCELLWFGDNLIKILKLIIVDINWMHPIYNLDFFFPEYITIVTVILKPYITNCYSLSV